MKLNSFPGYEDHLFSYMTDGSEETLERKKRQFEAMMSYNLPEGMTMEDRYIPGVEKGEELMIRVYTPSGLPEKAPMILDIHGGGFVAGSVSFDNARCIALASKVGAVVVAVEYRVTGGEKGLKFPAPMHDCYATYMYMHNHADEFGGDKNRIGLHGSSAGGTIAAGLALYLRDRGELTPALTVLNCPTLETGIEETMSYHQMYQLKMGPDKKSIGSEATYLGGYDGTLPSYYAFPKFCHDLGGLGATMVIAAEYDTLRDTGLEYGQRLLKTGVPCEIFVAGRVGHTFTAAPHPYTDFTHELMAWSFKREFGMFDNLKNR